MNHFVCGLPSNPRGIRSSVLSFLLTDFPPSSPLSNPYFLRYRKQQFPSFLRYLFMAFLLFLPGRCWGFLPTPPFMRLALNPLRSPELTASPDFAWRFFPPKPYFSFFLDRLALTPLPDRPPSRPPRLPSELVWLLISLSTPTSKRSASRVSRLEEFS